MLEAEGEGMKGKKWLSIQLPRQLVSIIDILRVDAPRSDIIEYFLTWYIRENLGKLLATESEEKRIKQLLKDFNG